MAENSNRTIATEAMHIAGGAIHSEQHENGETINSNKKTQRTLKIEESGDRWKGKIQPKIRLQGCWLEKVGFKPGNRVSITVISDGAIELRCKSS